MPSFCLQNRRHRAVLYVGAIFTITTTAPLFHFKLSSQTGLASYSCMPLRHARKHRGETLSPKLI